MGADAAQAYVLHTRRYGDSSLIVELFSRDAGRVAAVSKGALKAKRKAPVQAFQPYAVEIRGRGEIHTLTRAEPLSIAQQLVGRRLYCGFYINELLAKMTAREDPHPALFDAYAEALAGLGGDVAIEPLLRRFEVHLLRELGLGLTLDVDSAGRPIEPGRHYTYDVVGGAETGGAEGKDVYRGATLLALHTGRLDEPATLYEARMLMRAVIDHHLEGRPLRSRELFRS